MLFRPNSSFSNPMTTTGDIIYSSDNSGTGQRLGVGSNGQALVLSGGLPSWSSVSASATVNYLINGGFDYWQRGTTTTIANAASTYLADQWYVKNSLGTNGVITFSQVTGVTDRSKFGASVKITTAPTALQTNGCELYQVIENRVTVDEFYNQNASLSVLIKALGNVNQVGVQFFYATTEVKLTTAIGAEQTFTVNSATFTTCTIANQALGTAMTTSGVVGVRIRVTGVSTGNTYDLNNGFVCEQAVMAAQSAIPTFVRSGGSPNADYLSCLRFYEKSYDLTVNPGASTLNGLFTWSTTSASNGKGTVLYKVQKLKTASILFWDMVGNASRDSWWAGNNARTDNNTSASTDIPMTNSNGLNSFSCNDAINTGVNFGIQWTADASI